MKRRNYGKLFDHIFWFLMMVLPIFIYFTLNYHNPTATMDFFTFVDSFSPFTWLADTLDHVTVTAWGDTFALSKYLAYAFGVELCHVIYDVCAFIPRLAHKWIGRAVQKTKRKIKRFLAMFGVLFVLACVCLPTFVGAFSITELSEYNYFNPEAITHPTPSVNNQGALLCNVSAKTYYDSF